MKVQFCKYVHALSFMCIAVFSLIDIDDQSRSLTYGYNIVLCATNRTTSLFIDTDRNIQYGEA